jgi:hypothetical protein
MAAADSHDEPATRRHRHAASAAMILEASWATASASART